MTTSNAPGATAKPGLGSAPSLWPITADVDESSTGAVENSVRNLGSLRTLMNSIAPPWVCHELMIHVFTEKGRCQVVKKERFIDVYDDDKRQGALRVCGQSRCELNHLQGT